MASSASNHTPDPRPTGDLEHLFRQKLGEAEVPPRQHVWEQLDHELLVRQNDSYRRRLLLHRWVAAACVLLVLGCGGWLLLHSSTHWPPATEIAATTAQNKVSASLPSEDQSATRSTPGGDTRINSSNAAGSAVSAATQGSARQARTSKSAVAAVTGSLIRAAKSAVGISSSENLAYTTPTRRGQGGSGAENGAGGTFLPSLAETEAAQSPAWLVARPVRTIAERPAVAASFRRPETLRAVALPANTSLLAQVAKNDPQAAIDELPAESTTRGKWRVSGTYAASTYNPNIDFNSTGSVQGRALASGPTPNNSAPSSASRYQSAYNSGADEYRDNLQAGPAQRIVLAAAYPVSKHWTLLTGLETAQQKASSRTSFALNDQTSAFTARSGANSADFNLSYTAPRKTEFTYRTVGVPVAMQYGSTKTGLSLYAKVGAAVNVLLKSRTEVDGDADAARKYTLSSSESPYRKVLTSVRGGGGVRYQPSDATWSLALGPVAEAGLNTLNQNPGGTFFGRSRPYAVGLEASVEFGGQKAAAVAR